MKRLYIVIMVLFFVGTESFGQGKVVLGQYFQNLPAFSPSFTGANDYLDIRAGFRKQWTGFDGSPNTNFLSIYSPIRLKKNHYKANSLRSSTSTQYYKDGEDKNKDKLEPKFGIGGYVLLDDQGPFQELESMLSFAAHIPVAERVYLSLGISGGLINSKIDLSEITVVDDVNDLTYLSYVNDGSTNNFFNLNTSIGLHSESFYVSYSVMQLARTLVSGNDAVNNESASLRHHIMGGFRFFANEKWEIIPNTFLRAEANLPFFYEVGLRTRYNRNLWLGASYRSDQTYVGMLGFSFIDYFSLGYAYEFKSNDFDNFNGSSHEIIIGLRLFNYSNYTSIW